MRVGTAGRNCLEAVDLEIDLRVAAVATYGPAEGC